MKHTVIVPPDQARQGLPFTPENIDTLANHGLRELLFAPIPKLARALAGFDREQLGTAIEVMIAMLDAADGDPDDRDTNDVEDDFGLTSSAIMTNAERGPGCPTGDVGEHDGTEADSAWVEFSRSATQCIVGAPCEDDEEDDPSGVHDEDGINTLQGGRVGFLGDIAAGCPISDPGGCQYDG